MALFKRRGTSIFGCKLNKKEQAAMNQEIERQLAEWTNNHMLEIDAMFLWFMHEEFGYGPERLRRIFYGFRPSMLELINHYEMDQSDAPFVCTQKLLNYGIDLKVWDKEVDDIVENGPHA